MNLFVWSVILLQALALWLASFGLIWATLNTVQSHAVTLSNLHGPITVIATLLSCKPVSKNQIISTFIIIIAAILMVTDPYARRVGEDPNLLADMLAICVSIPWSLYF